MLKNFLVIAYRNMVRHKVITFINLSGLILGITAFLLIIIWVGYEMSFDSFNQNKDRIQRLGVDLEAGSHMVYPMSMPEAAPNLVAEYPEIIRAARLESPGQATLKIGNELFLETGICHGDNAIFEIFSFPFLAGNPQSALTEPFTAVISQSIQEKYFPGGNPLDEVIWIRGNGPYRITGVFADIPHNAHFRFQVMGSFSTLYKENPRAMENWFHIQFYTYLLLSEKANWKNLEAKLPEFVETHLGEGLRSSGGKLTFFLQPLTDIHLRSHLSGDIAPQSDQKSLFLFIGIAFFVLLLACINFINLATANSGVRAKEIGIRKIAGSERLQIVFQFLVESFILCFLAVLVSVSLLEIIRPNFNEFFGTYVDFNYLQPLQISLIILIFPVLIGILAGIYPAIFLSGLKPVLILKSTLVRVGRKTHLRSILVVFQFTVSIILIISTLTIFHQINFMKFSDPGFRKDSMIVVPGVRQITGQKSLNVLRKAMREMPEIEAVGFSSLFPGRGIQKALLYPEGFATDQPQMGEKLFIDAGFIPTMAIEIVQGRNFSADIPTDPSTSAIINQTAAEQFGWSEPLGKAFIVHSPDGSSSRMQVIGVVKDFHSTTLHSRIEPLIIYNNESNTNFMVLKISSSNIEKTLTLLKDKIRKLAPEQMPTYFFLDETLNRMYRRDIQTGKLALYFSILAIVLACLGLFGLTSFLVQKRTKEIGIRQVHGSSVAGIIILLSREFCNLVIISIAIAWPLSYLIMDRWLQNFAYPVRIDIRIFTLSGLISLTIALVVISFRTISAARANPVKALKYE
ncbi:MAG: ABC transporter permease [Candidatus Cloacimonetes bacterium]|nr:ABC transporter permease [Candidatus Cloacimonadota bacterium]